MKTTAIRVLTTLLDPDLYPGRELAALYARRWQVETAFLHLKKTVRGPRRVLRGRSVTLVRQEAWALLLVHNMIAAIAAQAASSAASTPVPSHSPPCCPWSAPTPPPTAAANTAASARPAQTTRSRR